MKKCDPHFNDRKSGQAIIFLIMVLVIGSIVVLWNFDLHRIVSTKIRIDNAGDAAALSAARWQGITLNMIGELNLAQVAFICDRLAEDSPENQEEFDIISDIIADEIDDTYGDLKRRLALVGPLMGLVAAQSSALKNMTEKDAQMVEEATSSYMKTRGLDFENSGGSYMGVVEEPYAGAWAEYGGLLTAIANNSVMAESGNTEYFLFYSGSHRLLNPDFYNAVLAPYYCYFKYSADFVNSFEDFTSWDPLPELMQRNTVNSEYFSTDVYEYSARFSIADYYGDTDYGYVVSLTNYYPDLDVDAESLTEDFQEYLEETSPAADADLDWMSIWGMYLDCSWHYFNKSSWMQKRSAETGKYMPNSDDFPFHEGWGFKDEYNYGGANAAVDVRIGSTINTPGMQLAIGDIYWQAAAKPFGYLEEPNGSGRVAPMYYGLVLPAFHDIRLIHNDLSTRPSGVDAPGWEEHIYEHVPDYLEGGVSAIEENDCPYCRALIIWEDESFRDDLSSWLDDNDEGIKNGTKCNEEYEGNPNMGRG
ncbi:hypothetical protein P4C99_19180 [Pontiellaceae bacterium B1224]|nr:hypothetical protein [Pontiellaceae bacterium B1224]